MWASIAESLVAIKFFNVRKNIIKQYFVRKNGYLSKKVR
jgi:hypothetical protein